MYISYHNLQTNGASVVTKCVRVCQGLLKEVDAWELLEMFILYLTPSQTNCLALINQIVTVTDRFSLIRFSFLSNSLLHFLPFPQLSSPKEMSLALMEQLQVTSSTSTLTLLLPSLQTGEYITCGDTFLKMLKKLMYFFLHYSFA